MTDINIHVETLKNHLSEHDASSTTTTSVVVNNASMEAERKRHVQEALRHISDYFSSHNQTTRFQDVRQYLSPCIQLMLKAMGDTSSDIRLSADDHLKKVIKARIDHHSDKILVVLFKSMKFTNRMSQKGAIYHFSNVCHHIRPQKCRTFVEFLLGQFTSMFQEGDPTIMVCGVFMSCIFHCCVIFVLLLFVSSKY